MSVTLLRVLEHREIETRRGGAGLAGFLNSRFVIQGPDFHIEPPLDSTYDAPGFFRQNKTAGSDKLQRWEL
ncbi:MAG TPA: hypothetical protein VKD04_13125 [Burkholderiales bacterium]|nr:hypothetical protein [Burkholderiales bacterium]